MVNTIYVWDKFVRGFHWALVALFLTSYLTGEENSNIHIYSGYLIAVLVTSRVIWGFVGTRHARFTDFVRSPAATIAYARSMIKGKPQNYSGHNPLGGIMVVALLITLAATCLSGMQLYALEEGKGPLAQDIQLAMFEVAAANAEDDDDSGYKTQRKGPDDEFWEEVHEATVNTMLLLILLHIGGVIFASLQHKESLVRAMITGRKKSQTP